MRENKLKERISYNLEKHKDLIKSYSLEFIYDYEIKDGVFADLAIFQNGHKLALMNNSECRLFSNESNYYDQLKNSQEHDFWGSSFDFWILLKDPHFQCTYVQQSNFTPDDFITTFRTFLYRLTSDNPTFIH